MGEDSFTVASIQSIFSKLFMLQENLGSYMILTSPRNLFPVDTQHRVIKAATQSYSEILLAVNPLFPCILIVKYVGFKCNGIIMTGREMKVL